MSALETLINDLSEEEITYLENTVFEDDGIIPEKKLDDLISYESTMYSQKDAVQFALKINLNSVYGVQIMPHFKFADEWQALGASTTLSGRILSKYGLIEAIEQYFNPERETRWEFPLLDNNIVAADDDDFFADPENQQLRSSVISDTDSVTGDAFVRTNHYGNIKLEHLEKHASKISHENNKSYYFFEDDLKISNYVDGKIIYDNVEYLYSHDVEKTIYEIELEDGKTIKVTEDHSIMVLDEYGEPTIEKKPFELTEDDVCVIND